MRKSVIIGTAGHIDHGKTALVKALTGVDTDRLPEEKARGITIDLGFAHTIWNGIDISFIDVPGHEKFVKNMLAGVGGIDLVLFVIAADESIMPQTREHFDICRILNIPSGIIAITKKDLVDAETLTIVRKEIADLVRNTFLASAPVYEVSSKTGEGISELKAGLIERSQAAQQRLPAGIFRLPVDRVFTLKGHGTIVTGTIISGSVAKDQTIEILPSYRRVRIRSIHAHDQSAEQAVAGQRTALNLMGVEKDQVSRGNVLTEVDFLKTTSLLDVKIILLETGTPIEHNTLVRFHHLTHDVLARVTLPGINTLSPGISAYAQLRLQKPICAVYGDRFILRKPSPLLTIGGGIILDHYPLRRISQNEDIDRFKKLESESLQQRLEYAVESKGIAGADQSFLKAKLAIRPDEILALNSESVIFLSKAPALVIAVKHYNDIISKMHESLTTFHRQNPMLPGIPKQELHTRLFRSVSTDLFESVLRYALLKRQVEIHKDALHLPGFRIALSEIEETLISKTTEMLRKQGLEFPGLEEISKQLNQPAAKVKQILYLLVRKGDIMKISDDYFVHAAPWTDLKRTIQSLKLKQKTFSVADFKSRFGVSRKYAIPLLEQLDREGITRRSGNDRIIL